MIRSPGPACEKLAALVESLANREDLRGERFLADVAAQCRQPLRVLVAGYVSTGKSTLINALLAERLAGVHRRETTAEVTWYRHPDLAGAPGPGPGHRAVEVAFPLADRIVLIDSPGLNTKSGKERSTLSLLSAYGDAAGIAAALVYLVVDEPGAEDVERMTDFTSLGSGDLGNTVLVGGKVETILETPIKESAERGETIEQSAVRTEKRLQIRQACVRPVAVSQHLAMVSRCGLVEREHVDLVREIVADPELRRFAENGWDQLGREWAGRGLPDARLKPLRDLIPSLGWLASELPQAHDIDEQTLTACCERVSRLGRLEQILTELADDADLLTATSAGERLRRWAARRGRLRATAIGSELDLLWSEPEFLEFPRRRAALLLSTSQLTDVPAEDREWAIGLLRRTPGSRSRSRSEFVRRWQLRTDSRTRGVLAADVAQIVVTTAARESDFG